jgi:hypothetical protein
VNSTVWSLPENATGAAFGRIRIVASAGALVLRGAGTPLSRTRSLIPWSSPNFQPRFRYRKVAYVVRTS